MKSGKLKAGQRIILLISLFILLSSVAFAATKYINTVGSSNIVIGNRLNTMFINVTSGKVGVGTSTPNAALQVMGGLTQDTGLSLINRVITPGRKELFASGSSDGIGSGAVPINTWMTPFMTNYSHGYGIMAFASGVFDGQNIWLVPLSSNKLVKLNPATGAMTNYSVSGYGANKFWSGVFDGQNIWLVPYYSGYLVKINPSTGAMTNYSVSGYGSYKFLGGVFDGQNIWLVPTQSTKLVKVNPATGAMTNYSVSGYGGFSGGVFDGQNIWLTPYSGNKLVKVNPATGAMTNYSVSGSFFGGVFDGQNIWLVPYGSTKLVKVNPATGAMTNYSHGYVSGAFWGGVFDGQNIWLVPYISDKLVKINPSTGAMTNYSVSGYSSARFIGGVFDGQNIWLVPYQSGKLVKVHPQEFGAESLYTTGVLNVGGYLADRATIGTSTINGNINVLNGKVGIGTTSLDQDLKVVGNANITQSVYTSKVYINGSLAIENNGTFVCLGGCI